MNDKNIIRKIETRNIETDNGNVNVIFISVDIYDSALIEEFIPEIINKFILHIMISPPDTLMFLVTVIGDVDRDEFCSLWKESIKKEDESKLLYTKFVKADVIFGTVDGQIIEEKSLLL